MGFYLVIWDARANLGCPFYPIYSGSADKIMNENSMKMDQLE